ncbi:GlxA family transcriptional regulator [Stenotrophomonas sp. ZAC14D2_NAIMI4_7]|uniref:GlxA family transcriptional regulator n=1 Tax=Stenotrophomonas sp. ZAC14D2_NAIMI4_7 TaxID=2072405 RepID=UPI00131F4790|nr:GlxA family transcriptional regulator [Stenotrophomonas sp. ZAC14D2_NAIMI4_7]
MLIYAGAQSLDISGPVEVFALASRQAEEDSTVTRPLYAVTLLALNTAPVVTSSGMRLLPDLACADMPPGTDTLLVCGGMGDALDIARADHVLVAWLGKAALQVRRVASVCSGALLLAEAGVLDGREATTHWSDVRELRERYPNVRVQADAIYAHDGHVWSSAGITAGMDMALAMVAEDHGTSLALKVAKRMVMSSKRSGGQSQFSRQLQLLDLPDQFQKLAQWMRENLQLRLSVDELSQRVHMSPRQFSRRFVTAFRLTPQKYVEQLRIEAAKPLLESTRKDIQWVAGECGFRSVDALRRAFARQLSLTPGEYRARFGTL